MTRRALVALCAVLACALPGASARAGTFAVLSQNTLHMGWGDPATYSNPKNAYLRDNQVGTAYDIVLLQEVMPKLGGLTTVWPNAPMGAYYVYQSVPQGASSYVETYGTLVKASLYWQPVQVNGTYYPCYTGGGFSRPPCAVLVRVPPPQPLPPVPPPSVYTWFIDYHAIFSSVANRTTEVRNMNAAVQWFQTQNVGGQTYARAVVGADWNFTATELTAILAIAGTITPDVETSLNRAGALSSRYDHFWCVGGVVCANGARIDPPPAPFNTLPLFRTNVSDHLAVRVDVTY
ncbi:MAG: hypothetical protein JOZ86_14785 [Candidatus Eremiobacteraeota bacterium]|nr:hypothetical protein [Candidatus Eremiobacteraeota bacterium]